MRSILAIIYTLVLWGVCGFGIMVFAGLWALQGCTVTQGLSAPANVTRPVVAAHWHCWVTANGQGKRVCAPVDGPEFRNGGVPVR